MTLSYQAHLRPRSVVGSGMVFGHWALWTLCAREPDVVVAVDVDGDDDDDDDGDDDVDDVDVVGDDGMVVVVVVMVRMVVLSFLCSRRPRRQTGRTLTPSGGAGGVCLCSVSSRHKSRPRACRGCAWGTRSEGKNKVLWERYGDMDMTTRKCAKKPEQLPYRLVSFDVAESRLLAERYNLRSVRTHTRPSTLKTYTIFSKPATANSKPDTLNLHKGTWKPWLRSSVCFALGQVPMFLIYYAGRLVYASHTFTT
eukprot:2135254-Rhodomonas_salina.1